MYLDASLVEIEKSVAVVCFASKLQKKILTRFNVGIKILIPDRLR